VKAGEVNRQPRDTPVRIRGLTMFAECLAGGWLAEISADLRGGGSALEAYSRRCAIQMAAFTLLTLL